MIHAKKACNKAPKITPPEKRPVIACLGVKAYGAKNHKYALYGASL